jgi:RNA polymerase sigma-70 factor (ECF subfamily)
MHHGEYIRLLMNHQVRISTYIQALVADYQDAEDIFQETAAIAWEKFDQYESGTSFASWAMTIARFRIMYYWKRNKKSIVHFSDATMESIEHYVSSSSPQPSNESMNLSYLEECIHKLSEKDTELIRIRYSQKITIKALAEKLGRSVNGLYSTFSRIHVALADCIKHRRLIEDQL